MSENKAVSKRLMRSLYATYRIISAYGRVTLGDLERESHIGRAQLFKHIRILERAGLVKRQRSVDKHTYIVVEKYVDREEFEKIIAELNKRKDVYDIAEEVLKEIRNYGLRADLIGTCKIHLEVLQHNRITDDINIVVLRDDFKYLELILKNMDFLKKGESQRIAADYLYELPTYKVFAYVAIDGIKHPYKNERYFDLSPVLRAKGRIDLEHAIAGKLMMIPSIRRDLDGEDIAFAIAYSNLNLKKLVSILEEVVEKYPDIVPVITRNIELVRDYLYSRGVFEEYAITKIRNSLNYIEQNIASERRTTQLTSSLP